MPMGAIARQVRKIAKYDSRCIAAFGVSSGVHQFCNRRLTAVGSDDNVGASAHARPAGILQRNVGHPAARSKVKVGKCDAMTDLSTRLAGRIDQNTIEYRPPWRIETIDTMLRLDGDADLLGAVMKARCADRGCCRGEDFRDQPQRVSWITAPRIRAWSDMVSEP